MVRQSIEFPNPYLNTATQTRREFLSNGLNAFAALLAAGAATAVAVEVKKIWGPFNQVVTPVNQITTPLLTEVPEQVKAEPEPVAPIPSVEEKPAPVKPAAGPEPVSPPTSGCAPGEEWNGVASFYTSKESTHLMADGKPLVDSGRTVAFEDAPLGSVLEITGPSGASEEDEVADRGGFKKLGRIIDLSRGVHDRLGIKGGLAQVHIKLVSCPKSYSR